VEIDLPVRIADVITAREKTKDFVVYTPLTSPEWLASRVNAPLWLKLENFQRSGAFKFRGALNCVLNINDASRKKGLVTASSGNHGLGMALASKLSEINAKVVMPERAPIIKQSRLRGYGAEVYLHGSSYDEAKDYAISLSNKLGAVYVPSFDHPDIIAGQGVIGLEIILDMPDVRTIVAPIGGGGLMAGLLITVKTLLPSVKVVGVQAEGSASTIESIRQGQRIQLDQFSTVADGIAVGTPGKITYPVINYLLDDMATVSDDEILESMALLAMEGMIITEPAGAVSFAAVLNNKIQGLKGPIVCIVSGGNTDNTMLQNVLELYDSNYAK